jgi:hypothetical protein
MASRIALALVAVLAVAGCGGSSRLSRSEFVKRANAVCTEYEAKVTRAMAGINPGDQTQLASAIDKALPVIREGNDKLRALKPPEDLQQRFDRWLRIADNEVTAATQLRDGLKKDDAKAVQRAFEKLRVSDAAQDTVARRGLGLKRCARSSEG